jgi:hypothetical protein
LTERNSLSATDALGLLGWLALGSILASGCNPQKTNARSAPDAAAQGVAGIGSRATVDLCARYQATATVTPSYATIQRLFDEQCVACHGSSANLPLSPGPAWDRIVGRAAPVAESCGDTLVTPGHPEASYLYIKLSSDHPCAGSRMPAGEFGPTPLPDCLLSLVARWISAGAPGP